MKNSDSQFYCKAIGLGLYYDLHTKFIISMHVIL